MLSLTAHKRRAEENTKARGPIVRARRMTAEQRAESARKAAQARWSGTPEERKIERAKGRIAA